MKKIIVLFLVLLITFHESLFAQASLEVFGQNRVQHRQFEWKFYDAPNFKIYHYDRSGRELARYVAEQAEKDITAIQQKSGKLFKDRLNIILYNSFDDFEQSNIGLNSELQMQNNNPAGTVNIIGDKLVIYFTGQHSDLKKQLRQGMAQVIMEHLMFGENIREMVRNAVLLDLPEWITIGYVDYIVDGWTAKDDSEWKNQVNIQEEVHFHDLSIENPRLAGKAFWKYIATVHGEGQVRNLLYVTQLKNSLNKAVRLTLNQKIRPTYDSLISYYQERYAFEQQYFEHENMDSSNALIQIPTFDPDVKITDVKVSPRGYDVAFVEWNKGEFKVIIEKSTREKVGKERSTILYGGVKNHMEHPDPDYPLLAWSNTGFKLGMIYKSGNYIMLRIYDAIKGEMKNHRIPKSRFDRITGFTFMEDDDKIMMTAIKRGQSDLFEMRLRGYRLKQITDDTWDEKEPTFVSGGARKGVVFLSNRPDPFINIKPLPNELPNGKMNAFFYNETTKSYDLLRLTNNEEGEISQVIPFGSDYFAYLSDKNGVRNRYVVLFARDVNNMDSAYSVPVTNYEKGILYHQYNAASGKIAEVLPSENELRVFFKDVELPQPLGNIPAKDLKKLKFVDGVAQLNNEGALPLNFMEAERTNLIAENLKIETGDYFQNDFYQENNNAQENIKEFDSNTVLPNLDSRKLAEMLAVKETSDTTILQSAEESKDFSLQSIEASTNQEQSQKVFYVDSTFMEMRSSDYKLSFRPDFFSVRLDNSVIFNRYQSYSNNGGQYRNPNFGGMIMAQLFDKMEDYRFTGGIRIPANFSGLTYFLQFENLKRRTDWSLMFMRDEQKNAYNFIIDPTMPSLQIPGKTTLSMLQGSASYPLNKVQAFNFHLGVRHDKMVLKAQEFVALFLPSVEDVWMMSRAEYVHDDTRNPTINIWNGTRYKIFAEYMYKIYSDNNKYVFGENTEFIENGGFYNIGFDYRYYHKIYKNFIAAFRVAGAHSGGNQQILYFLGGVENPINNTSNETPLQPSGKNNYAFQALATNLRGYTQNARNGNTFALLNAELRLPIVSTFSKTPVQSPILKHLQAIAFVDIGSAWEGFMPTEENLIRDYNLKWPANIQNPTIHVKLPYDYDNGIAVGFGAGLRTMLFGYFARVDAAWNVRKEFNWYISIGTDF